jgi:transcriptional regulator with PAS, ATPase and Fis domain
MTHEWIQKFPAAITVCDAHGVILEMNDKAAKTFENEGGASLVGSNLMDCHNTTSRNRIKELLATGSKNVYTIEKQGKQKLIYQAPWFENGVCMGLVELSLEIPTEMPHFIRS